MFHRGRTGLNSIATAPLNVTIARKQFAEIRVSQVREFRPQGTEDPGSQGEDRREELSRFGQAPEAGSAWELGAGEAIGSSVVQAQAAGEAGPLRLSTNDLDFTFRQFCRQFSFCLDR